MPPQPSAQAAAQLRAACLPPGGGGARCATVAARIRSPAASPQAQQSRAA
ncbi:MAG: hypothetical protein GX571_09215 [Lentisphaerae bacterium]|nr:hypothetical protein [Lentisphaerota bacterium]